VGDDQPAVVEDVVADEAIEEADHALAEGGRLALELGERLRQAVVVARDAQRRCTRRWGS
jgi:hypothetical protein